MKLEDQCASLELCKRLKGLGVKQESFFKWIQVNHPKEGLGEPHIQWDVGEDYDNTLIHDDWTMTSWSAFTVAELVEMLPAEIGNPHLEMSKTREGDYSIEYLCSNNFTVCKTFPNACAEMLIHLIEQGHVKV